MQGFQDFTLLAKRDKLMKIVTEAPSITDFLTGNLYSMFFLCSFIILVIVRIKTDLRTVKQIGRGQASKHYLLSNPDVFFFGFTPASDICFSYQT